MIYKGVWEQKVFSKKLSPQLLLSVPLHCQCPACPTRMHFSIPIPLGVVLFASYINASMNTCPSGPSGPSGKALYLQSNEQQNSVISIPIGNDGMLYGGITTLTGGMGGDSINGMTHTPAGPDALSSQGSVFVIDDVSFHVTSSVNSQTHPEFAARLRCERRIKYFEHVQNQQI